jgi:transposase
MTASDFLDAGQLLDEAALATHQAPGIDVKTLHAKIRELTLVNDFLESALGKAGLLSAKR